MANSIPMQVMQNNSIPNMQSIPIYPLKILNMENNIYGRIRSVSTVQSYTRYSVRGGKWSLNGCKRRLTNRLHFKHASLVTKAGTRKPIPLDIRDTGLWNFCKDE